jgi:hypothetical protein
MIAMSHDLDDRNPRGHTETSDPHAEDRTTDGSDQEWVLAAIEREQDPPLLSLDDHPFAGKQVLLVDDNFRNASAMWGGAPTRPR